MKVYKEVESYSDFEFWGYAAKVASILTADEIERVFADLEYQDIHEMSETELNDYFAFECDEIAMVLGYDSWEEILNERT